MKRRAYLGGAGAALTLASAGCLVTTTDDEGENESGETDAADGENGENGEGDGDDEEETEELDAGDVVELVEHSFGRSYGNFAIEVTVKNIADEELNRVAVDVALFDDNHRIDTARIFFSDLPPGISESDHRSFPDLRNPENVTHYTLTVEAEHEVLDELDPVTHEFDGDEFRDRLYGE